MLSIFLPRGGAAGLPNGLGEFCGGLLEQDENGQLVVDIAAGSVAARMREPTSDVLAAVTAKVPAQLKRDEVESDTESVMRYRRLQRRLPQPPRPSRWIRESAQCRMRQRPAQSALALLRPART